MPPDRPPVHPAAGAPAPAGPAAGSDAPATETRGLAKRFGGGDWAVAGVDLSVRRGEILTVLGPSGCGKTTLLRLIGGFEVPDRGEVRQHGRVISRPGWVLPPERRHIGMVFQEYSLFPHLSVRENVQFGLVPSLMERLRSRRGAAQGGAAADERRLHKRGLVHLMDTCGLIELADRYPHELSGGQQQRVALARALATAPDLLLMDEPFSSLDAHLRRHLRDEVRRILRAAGTTCLLVTHDQEEAVNLGDRLAVMNRGCLEQVGAPEELLSRPANRFVASFVGMNRFLPGRVAGGQVLTELGAFPLPPQGAPAEAVDVLLRPSQLRLCHGDAARGGAAAAAVQALVRRVEYLGGQPLYTLELPSGLTVDALLPEAARLAAGDRAPIRYEPAPLVIFPAA